MSHVIEGELTGPQDPDPKRSSLNIAVYDGFCRYYDGASPERQTKILLCEIPDGRLPLQAAAGVGAAQARVTATRALLSFLYRAAASHPKLRMYTRPMS